MCISSFLLRGIQEVPTYPDSDSAVIYFHIVAKQEGKKPFALTLLANVARPIINRMCAAGLPVVDVSLESLFLFPGYSRQGGWELTQCAGGKEVCAWCSWIGGVFEVITELLRGKGTSAQCEVIFSLQHQHPSNLTGFHFKSDKCGKSDGFTVCVYRRDHCKLYW